MTQGSQDNKHCPYINAIQLIQLYVVFFIILIYIEIVYDQWQEDPESEIFIERDGERFKYCLDYLRDGRVMLPITMSKGAVMEDLKYYGVESVDEEVVYYNPSKEEQSIHAFSCVYDVLDRAEKEIHTLKIRRICKEAALFCFKKHIETNSLTIRYSGDSKSSNYTSIAADIETAINNKEKFNDENSCIFPSCRLKSKSASTTIIIYSTLQMHVLEQPYIDWFIITNVNNLIV